MDVVLKFILDTHKIILRQKLRCRKTIL